VSIIKPVEFPTFELDSKIPRCRIADCLAPGEQIICASHAKFKQVQRDFTTT
jgi:hypothetical protein